jgi:hypothetical protein
LQQQIAALEAQVPFVGQAAQDRVGDRADAKLQGGAIGISSAIRWPIWTAIGCVAERLRQPFSRPPDLADRLAQMHRQANGATLVAQRPDDRWRIHQVA